MTLEPDNAGIRILESRIRLKYTWWVGEWGSRFYRELRERCRIWGVRCPECKKVYVPPKRNCPKCFSEMHEWVELPPRGRLLTYTVVRYPVHHIQPQDPPFGLGIIQLNGADSGLPHLIGGMELGDLHVGMRVQAVFREQRKGNLRDIEYFRPVYQEPAHNN